MSGPPRPKRALRWAWTALPYNRCGAGKQAAAGRESEARGGSGPEMADRVMYGENRWVTACEREETRVVVLVHVNDLGLPSAKSSPYLMGGWVRERANRT